MNNKLTMVDESKATETALTAAEALRTNLFAYLLVTDLYLGMPDEDVIRKRSVGGPAVYRFAAVRHARKDIVAVTGMEPTATELKLHLEEEFMIARGDYFVNICASDLNRIRLLPDNPFNEATIQEVLERDFL